jgi:hypothetical protein
VTVANRTADLKVDPVLPNIADFSIDLPLTEGMTRVIIRVTPSSGPFFEATYNVEFQARPNASAPPRASPSAPSGAAASAAPPSPWQEMQPRHKWYYAGAALGLAMAFIHTQSTSEVCVPTVAGQNCYNRTTKTSYTVPGLGVVFATGTAAILDYRKTATRLENEQSAAPRGPRLQPPSVGVQDGRFNLSLVRIRF